MELTNTAQIRAAIREIPRSEWDALARASEVPRSTIEKIAYGVTENPSFDSMIALAAVLRRRDERAA